MSRLCRDADPLPNTLPFVLGDQEGVYLSELKQGSHNIVRRLFVRRRSTSGEYEDDWQEIDETRIIKFGRISYSIDVLRPSFFTESGVTVEVANLDGFFSENGYAQSFWSGYLPHKRTLIKIEAAYLVKDVEVPADVVSFVGVIDDVKYNTQYTASIKVKPLLSVFDDVKAADLPISTLATKTASNIVQLIRDHEDSNGVAIFQKFITTGAWNISQTNSQYSNLDTSTAFDNMSCLSVLKQLAESEAYVVYTSQAGEFFFGPRNTPASATFSFRGGTGPTGANTILELDSYTLDYDKVYNQIRIRISEQSTSTSYYELSENWTWGDSSSSFLYGVTSKEMVNYWIDTATAAEIAQRIYDEFGYPKFEVNFRAKWVPHIGILDRIGVSYANYSNDIPMWGTAQWDTTIWGSGDQQFVELSNAEFSVIGIEHDLDRFTTEITGRQL